jgi:type VI protein secretion system component VasK
MTFDETVKCFQIGSAVVAVVSLMIGVWNYYRQMNAQVFMKYAERYEKIMEEVAKNSLQMRFGLDEHLPEQSELLTLAVLKYPNLCSEEFYLQKNRYISRKVWNIWKEELERMLNTPLVRREWKTLKNEFQSYRDFVDYVEQVQAKGSED